MPSVLVSRSGRGWKWRLMDFLGGQLAAAKIPIPTRNRAWAEGIAAKKAFRLRAVQGKRKGRSPAKENWFKAWPRSEPREAL